MWQRYDTTLLLNPDILHNAQASLNLRLTIWRLSLQLVSDHPLTGIGLGAFQETFADYFPNLPLAGGLLTLPHAHNIFVQLALDLGIPGLLAYLGLMATLIRPLLLRLQHTGESRANLTYPLAIGVISALAATVVVGCFDNALWGTKLLIIPWCLLALAQLLGDPENANVLTP